MFKKILVICAISALFSSAIFAAEQETNQQIMLPITAGTHTFQVSDFDSQGNASFRVPVSCPSPYLSPSAKHPWVMAYPSEIVPGDETNVGRLIIVPKCDETGCSLAIIFGTRWLSDYRICASWSIHPTVDLFLVPGACPETAERGHLTITYVAYCSTQPIQSNADKHEPEPAK